MSEYTCGYDDGKGAVFDELMVEITSLREQLKDCSAAFDRQQEQLDRNAERIAGLREQLKQVEAGYATRNDEVTGLLGMNAELREQLAAAIDAAMKEEGK